MHHSRPCPLSLPGRIIDQCKVRIDAMARIVLFNKPYGVLSQFTPEGRWRSLAEFVPLPGVYPAGRLDADSEGLLLLTDDGVLQHRLAHPRHKAAKVYWAQVEGIPDAVALGKLAAGVDLGDFRTQPCKARAIAEPAGLWPRDPPIRVRKHIPDAWIEITLREGKNRQVRRMCAATGFPVLRLIRAAIGPYSLEGQLPGTYRVVDAVPDGDVEALRPRRKE
jgi:23S rRNA pseudouridine2457 synthase